MNGCTAVERQQLRRRLEMDLHGMLRMPVSEDPGGSGSTPGVEEEPWQALPETKRSAMLQAVASARYSIGAARRAAESVGSLPQAYPWHVSLVIRVVNALLPWYTRTVRQAAFQAVETLELQQTAIESLAISVGEICASMAQQAKNSATQTPQGEALRPGASDRA